MQPEERFGLDLYSPAGKEFRPEWDMRLVTDVALGTSTESILAAYDLTQHGLDQILETPTFLIALQGMKKSLEQEGATFRLKAQIQADMYLGTAHEMIMNKGTDSRVRMRLIEDMARWAGFDTPPQTAGGGSAGFSISINFSQAARDSGRVLDHEDD